MRTFTISLTEQYPFLQGGELQCILSDDPHDVCDRQWNRPAVLVVPGGAYREVSRREGEPVAAAFSALGFQTFVLTYLCHSQGVRYPEQLLSLAAAVDCIKRHAAEWNVDKDNVFPVGFSAGGHLVGTLATAWNNLPMPENVALDCRVKAVGMCYPVISARYGHTLSHELLLDGYSEAEKAKLSAEVNVDEAVSADTPPAFLWTTAEDGIVPSVNALHYAMALAERNILYELHVYPQGEHGLSVGSLEINADLPALKRIRRWVGDCAEFFRLFCPQRY